MKSFLADRYEEYELKSALDKIEGELTETVPSKSKGKKKEKKLKCFSEFYLIKNFVELAIRYKNESPVADLEKRLVKLEESQESCVDDIADLKGEAIFD